MKDLIQYEVEISGEPFFNEHGEQDCKKYTIDGMCYIHYEYHLLVPTYDAYVKETLKKYIQNLFIPKQHTITKINYTQIPTIGEKGELVHDPN